MTTVITGTRAPGVQGDPYLTIRESTAGVVLTDFQAARVGDGIIAIGASTAIEVDGLDFGYGVADDIYRMLNMSSATSVLRNFHIHDITGTNLERGGLRLQGAHDGLIENVIAIARPGGTDLIPTGFALSYAPASNITYRNCTAGGFRQNPRPGKYVNGDGFSDEHSASGITYEDCRAYDNADGGIDSKSFDVAITRFLSERNRWNYRFWGSGTVTDCVSVSPGNSHVWFGGDKRGEVTLVRPVFIGPPDRPHLRIDTDGPKITVIDPVLPEGEELRIQRAGTGVDAEVEVVVAPPLRIVDAQLTTDGVTYTGRFTEVRA